MTPTTIVHLVDTLYPYGTERQLLEQLRRLDRRRWRPLVASLHREGPMLEDLAALGVPHAAFPLHTSLGHPNSLVQMARLGEWCRRERCAILHAHDFYSNLIGLGAGRLARARVIVSRRDLAHWLSPLKRRLLGWGCRAADHVVANGRLVAEHATRELGVAPAHITVVPNGIDLARFDAEAQLAPSPALDLPDEPALPILAVVANMHLPDKGHGDLLEALALMRQRGQLLRALLVGAGAERARLEERAARLGLAAHIYFLGHRADVPRILARADLACLPSWAEGFPNAVMEAMAARLPVVATRVGGSVELIEHGTSGLLVPPRDPAALAEALGRILGDREAARAMGRAGRATIEARYQTEVSAAVLDRLYGALIAGQPLAAARAEAA